MIFHIDIDAFFASVEEKYYPEYKHLPLVVGGQTQSGVIGTCNYIARKYGVKKGEPVALGYAKCANLINISHHRSRYDFWSKKFFAYLKEKFSEQTDTITIKAYPFNENKDIKAMVDSTMASFPTGLTEEKFFAKPILTKEDLKTATGVGG